MVAGILLDRISDNNSNCTDLNWIHCWFFLSLIHSFRKVFYFGKTKMRYDDVAQECEAVTTNTMTGSLD